MKFHSLPSPRTSGEKRTPLRSTEIRASHFMRGRLDCQVELGDGTDKLTKESRFLSLSLSASLPPSGIYHGGDAPSPKLRCLVRGGRVVNPVHFALRRPSAIRLSESMHEVTFYFHFRGRSQLINAPRPPPRPRGLTHNSSRSSISRSTRKSLR